MSVLGTIVSDLKKAGEDVKNFLVKVAGDAPAIVQTVVADESAIAPVIEEFVPGSTTAINVANSLLDKVAQAVEDAGPAATANGLSVSLDQAIVNDIKAVIAAAKAAFAPAASAAPAAKATPAPAKA
jgi:hypothetical protein